MSGDEMFGIISWNGLAGAIYPLLVGGLFTGIEILTSNRATLFRSELNSFHLYYGVILLIASGIVTFALSILIVPLSIGLTQITLRNLSFSNLAAISAGNVPAIFLSFLYSTLLPSFRWEAIWATILGPVFAIFLAQCAGRIGQLRNHSQHPLAFPGFQPTAWRFSIWQLFKLTTGVCLALTLLRLLGEWSWDFAVCVSCAIATQLLLLPITGWLVRSVVSRGKNFRELSRPPT